MSSRMSSGFSMPTERRIRSGETPASFNCSSVIWRCVVLAGCSTQVRRCCDVRDDGGKLQAVHKAGGRFPAALDAEGNDAAGAVRACAGTASSWHGLLSKTRIVDPRHAVVLLEELAIFCAFERWRSMRGAERFHAEVEVKCVHRGGLRANVAHQVAARFCDIRRLTEVLGIHDAVIRSVRLLLNSGNLPLFQSKLPLSTMAPPSCTA